MGAPGLTCFRWCWGFACLLAVLAQATPALASVVVLTPDNTTIGLTIFALGLFPQSGHFARFLGRLQIDPAHPADCQVDLQVQVASLEMSSSTTARLALGASMLDAARFPTMRFRGSCDLGQTTGQLTMHGVTRGLGLVEERTGTLMKATGALHRQDFGVSGLPGVIGGTVNIKFSMDLPADLAARLSAAAQ
jgi:polyisoprenoid-binding protein YceI